MPSLKVMAKSEGRDPKTEGRPKSEARKRLQEGLPVFSDLGFRASDLVAAPYWRRRRTPRIIAETLLTRPAMCPTVL
jgi:hypothetical protein